jgi:nicotinate-nucleotide pyrophosphorylase (carboxylating)
VRVNVSLKNGEIATSLTPLSHAPFSLLTERLLQDAGLSAREVSRWVDQALAEDSPGGVDLTSQATIAPEARATVNLVARQHGVIAGVPLAAATFDTCAAIKGGECAIEVLKNDGETVAPQELILRVSGNARALLMAERTALNYLGHLSGVVTGTREWVKALDGTGCQVRDTRKTTPGLRKLEKYAVRVGGGVNHRMDLADAILIKDNHIVAAGGVAAAMSRALAEVDASRVQIEVDDLDGLKEALTAGAREILLDNFDAAEIARAVAMNAGRAKLEVSGGLRIENARELALLGVDYLAVGALTHSAPNLDVGADFILNAQS